MEPKAEEPPFEHPMDRLKREDDLTPYMAPGYWEKVFQRSEEHSRATSIRGRLRRLWEWVRMYFGWNPFR